MSNSLLALGLSEKERNQYSLVRGINEYCDHMMKSSKGFVSLESEVSKEIGRRTGAESMKGFFVPDDVTYKRDLSVGTATAGGHTVSNDIVGVIPVLRNEAHVTRLGATVIDNLSESGVGNFELPRITTGGSVEHLGENDAASGTDPAFDNLTLTPHRTFAALTYSRQLFLQTSGAIDEIIASDMSQALIEDVDKMALVGTGSSNQPQGVMSQSGISEVTFGGAPTWDKLLEIEDSCAIRASGNYAFITTSTVRKKWKQTAKVSGADRFLWESEKTDPAGYGAVAGYAAAATGNMDGTTNKVVFGNWRDLLIGVFGAVEVQPDPFTLAASGKIRISYNLNYDVAPRRASSFVRSADSAAQ